MEDNRQPAPNGEYEALQESEPTADVDAAALRRLHEVTLKSDDFAETVDRILSFGCENLDLETGILSRISGTDYHIRAVVDGTGNHKEETVLDLGQTMCEATAERGATEPLAFADSADTDHSTHPAADDVRAYIGVPVVVDGDTYGTVNFSSTTPREDPIQPGELEFVKLISQWIGVQIERDQRIAELERYEAIVEAIDDPVYALDTEGQFTFVNEAAEREFGYEQDILGEHVSIGMKAEDVERIKEQRKTLAETDKRSVTAQFDLETADGDRKIAESRLAVIGDEEFRGTAGVLRDITEREARRQRLESFQQAIEEAADGVAILEDGEYVYADQTHVDMYGFESTDQLLGDSWQKLYDDEEAARLESEAFPALESDGSWRGKVTGSRPDGTTFPAELSLTIVDDGRLVCTVRDETERTARKQELELKERAMDETNVSIQITDPTRDGNPLIYVNDGFERMTGYSREEALGRNPRFLQGPESDPEKIARLRTAIDAEEPVTMEVVNYRRDGTPYWAKLSVTPVYDDEGTLQNYIGIQQDVTDRRRLLETLEDRTERLELVLSGTGTGIAEWDLRTDELTWDETLTETFGHDPATIEEWREFVHSDDRDDILAGLEKTIETGEPWSGAFRLTTGSGDLAWLESRCVPVYEDGEPVRVLATGTDVTQRKQREQEREATVEVLERVYEITTDPDRSFEQKVESLLAAGSEYLDFPYGYLTNIEPDTSDSGTQTIVEAHGSHERLQPGESCPLPQAYCKKTIESDGLVTVTNAGEAGWDGDPAYDVLNLETYIGGKVTADGDVYGTLCFAAREPREQSFSETEQSVVGLFQRWVGYEIDRELARTNRRQQQERLDLVLSETGTGIAEWDLRTDEVVWDETFQENFGRNPETLDAFTEIFHPDDRERVQEQLEEMIETGEQWDDAFRVITGRGEVAWYGVRAVPVCEDGEPVKVLATGSDVTERKQREQALAESRERYETLLQAAPDPVIVADDVTGEIVETNAAAAALRDESREEIIGRHQTELFPSTETEAHKAAITQAVESDGLITELADGTPPKLRTVDGETIPVEITADTIDLPDGPVIYGVFRDVSDRIEKERELELKERAMDEANVGITISDPETPDNSLIYVNQGFVEQTGYSREAALGRNCRFLQGDDRDQPALDTLREAIRDEDPVTVDLRNYRRNGELFWNRLSVTPVYDDGGTLVNYIGIQQDLTEQKQRARRLEAVFNGTFQFTGLVRPDGTIIEGNDTVVDFVPYAPEEIVGVPLSEAPWWTQAGDVNDRVRDAVDRAADGDLVRFEIDVHGNDGIAHIDFSLKPVTDDDGEVALLIAEGRDITAYQQQRQHLEVIQRVMRHNMRNDLMKLRGWAEILATESDAEQRADHYERIERILDKWEKMNGDLKRIERALRSQQKTEAVTGLLPLVSELVSSRRDAHPDATIDVNASDVEPARIPATIREALRELVDNAIGATDHPDPHVDIRLSRPDDWVKIEVVDNGPGMPEMEAEVLETGEETPLNHGQGLGVWMVRMLVTQIGGEVSVDITGDGTSVSLRIPTHHSPGGESAVV